MKSFKKVHILVAFVVVTCVFFLFQFTFISNIRLRSDQTGQNSPALAVEHLRPKKPVETNHLNNNLKNVPKNSAKTKKISKLLLPLDKEGRPFLNYSLPFFYASMLYSHFGFQVVFVDAPDDATANQNLIEKSPLTSEFIGIEAENKILDKNSLRTYDMTSDKASNLRGVNQHKAHLYQPDADGRFDCLNSNQKIPYSALNDDYCDCADGTDEPGTSACLYSIFYCSTQNEYLTDNYIPSLRVDDKICDCCDGSDESSDTKCPDRCQAVIDSLQSHHNLQKKAQNIKRKYLVEGVFKNEELYGPSGVFYKLSKACFKIRWSEFEFEVCPYKKVTQYKPSERGDEMNLGTRASLVLAESHEKKSWIIKMDDGDARFCTHARRSEIELVCSIEEKLKQVQEPEKCVYVFVLETPAAC